MLKQTFDNRAISFTGDKFVILGLGVTGLSVLRYLHHKQAKIISIIDTRGNQIINSELSSYNSLITPDFTFKQLRGADVIVLSPGISIYNPIIKECINSGIRVIGDIELFALAIKDYPTKVIAVTGSNGKTTVTTLINHLVNQTNLVCKAAGNIGLGALDCYLDMLEQGSILDVIALELSSFQLESTYSLKCEVATVLNISEDHLDRYANLLTYAYVKSKLCHQTKLQVINFDDPLVKAMVLKDKAYSYFSRNHPEGFHLKYIDNTTYICKEQDIIYDCQQLNILGEHNYLNVLAALACVSSLGLKTSDMQSALSSFKGLEHRMQRVLVHDKVTFIDDSKGTNVGAVIAGISGLDMPIHLILGGDAKGQDFYPLIDIVKQKCKSIAIIGKDAKMIYDVLIATGVRITCYSNLSQAVRACIDQAIQGDCVLLSPACSSLDMFNNYAHRSQVFIESIHAYI